MATRSRTTDEPVLAELEIGPVCVPLFVASQARGQTPFNLFHQPVPDSLDQEASIVGAFGHSRAGHRLLPCVNIGHFAERGAVHKGN